MDDSLRTFNNTLPFSKTTAMNSNNNKNNNPARSLLIAFVATVRRAGGQTSRQNGAEVRLARASGARLILRANNLTLPRGAQP